MKRTGNIILITGGGSGIGAALAQRLHDRGNVVIVAGRRRDALEETAREHGFGTVQLDTTDPDSIREAARTVVAEHPGVNAILLSAGIMEPENYRGAGFLDTAERTVATNLLGPIRLIDAFVDHLKGQSDAAIVNVTSGLAFVPLAPAATYSATKAAIHSYTLSLREMLKGKIEVIELAPPGVQTDLTPGQSTREGYQPLDDFADEVMGLLDQQPTPPEILVEMVRPFRTAEKDGKLDNFLTMLVERAKDR